MAAFGERDKGTPGVVALITDFGWRDGYVGAMKGVILGINPRCHVVDVAHEVPPHDVMAGALVLRGVHRYFPQGTVFLVVVDPGVGGRRRPLVLEAGGHLFVGPDNGVFTFILKRGDVRAFHLMKRRFFLEEISSTFHGRDIFAPAAAHLTLGVRPEEMGPAIPPEELALLSVPEPVREGETVFGEVIYVDRFGNLVTNLRPEDLRAPFVIEVGGEKLLEIKASYEEGKRGEVIALWGSSGLLELSMREEPLRERRGWGPGQKVLVHLGKEGKGR